MERGFKSNAKRKSLEIRDHLEIKVIEALDSFKLLEFLEIPTFPVSKLVEFEFSTENIETICYARGQHQFSATTIKTRTGFLVLYNQTHSLARTNSSLAHEAAHIICKHEFSSILDMKMGSREFDKDKEDEANWMAGCLLLPEEGLIWALNQKLSIKDIAISFNISQQMTQWRYNSTGMAKRMKHYL